MSPLRLGLAGLTLAVAAFLLTPFEATGQEQRFPDVVGVKIAPRGEGRFDLDVTISSPYDTPKRYADAFRVKDASGKVLGQRILLHDHADEQPFTRDLYGIVIPPAVKVVIVEARDSQFGWGGKAREATVPGR